MPVSLLFTPCNPLVLMEGRISKSPNHLGRLEASQQQQLDAVVTTGEGVCIDIAFAKQGTLLSEQQRTPPKHRHTTLPESKTEGQETASPATRLQKRQIGSNDNNEEYHSKRARLTRENLAILNKTRRKKAIKAPALSESTVESSTTITTSATTSDFTL